MVVRRVSIAVQRSSTQAMAEDVISAAVASGERGVSLSSLSLHALPDSLSSLAGLQELDLSDNFIVPGVCW